jgi:hypothetical protein
MANRHVRPCGAIIAIALAALIASVAASTATASVVVGASKAPQRHADRHAKCMKRHGKRVRACGRKAHRASAPAQGSAPASGGTTVGVSATFSTAPDCAVDPLHVNCAQLPLDFITTNDCITPPPFVEILGVYHVVAQTTENPDGTTTMKAYTNFQNSFGQTVSVNPTKYQANLTDHEYERIDPTGVALDEAFDENYELISNDSSPNMLVRFDFRVHVDAFGVPTVSISGTSAKCAGQGGTSPLPTP